METIAPATKAAFFGVLALGVTLVTACSSNEQPTESPSFGTVTMPLLTTVGTNTYRLDAVFVISGAQGDVTLSTAAGEPSLSTTLPAGSYSAFIQSFTLSKDDGTGTLNPVNASVESSTQPFTVFANSTTTVHFQFETDGTPLDPCATTPWVTLQKLVPSDGGPDDTLTVSVSVSADRAMLGAVSDEEYVRLPGSVYAFARSGADWVETQKLVAPDSAPGDRFGFDVALDGDNAIVGAIGAEPDGVPHRGAAYVFTNSGSGWHFVQKLVGPGTGYGSRFGWYVTISGDTAAAASDDGAYVYRRSAASWSLEQVLFPNAVLPSLSLEGDTLLAGYTCAPDSTPDLGCFGAASVFVRSGTSWTEQQRLVSSDGTGVDNFGSAVALTGDWAFVAANLHDEKGAVYAFRRTGTVWTERQILTGSDTPPSGLFGWQIAATARDVMVDAAYQSATFAFELVGDDWIQRQKLTPLVGAGPSWGSDVALSGQTAFLATMEGSPQEVRTSATVVGPCGN